MIKNYIKYTKFDGVRDVCVYNFIKSEDSFIIRILAPKSSVREDFILKSSIDASELLNSKLFFNNESCVYKPSGVIGTTIDNVEYALMYESTLSLKEMKEFGSWHPGALCMIYAPTLARLYRYNSYIGNIVSMCWHRDSKHGSNLEEHEKFHRRLNQIENIIQFSVNDSTSNPSNVSSICSVPEGAKVIANFKYEDLPKDMSAEDLMVDFEVNYEGSVTENGFIYFTVKSLLNNSLIKLNKKLTINTITGYAPKKQIQLIDGIGSFKLSALYLEKGDELKFQILDYDRICTTTSVPVI